MKPAPAAMACEDGGGQPVARRRLAGWHIRHRCLQTSWPWYPPGYPRGTNGTAQVPRP